MAIASYTVERYRSFVRRTTVELRPLTLLFGYNSAGKSSLLRALPLLAASTGGAVFGPLALDAEVARKAAYGDIRSRLTKRNDLVLGVAWDDDAQPVREIEMHFREEGKLHILGELIARNAAGKLLLKMTDEPDKPGRYQVEGPDGITGQHDIALDGIRPSLAPEQQAKPQVQAVIEACAARIGSLKESVHWLGAVRAQPERRSPYGSDPSRLGGDGRFAGHKLAHDQKGANTVFPRVTELVKEVFGHSLFIQDEGAEFALQFDLPPAGSTANRASIVDTGEGVTQVLPVLVLGAMAEAGALGQSPVLAIEQPEMHLHPAAEQTLARFLCEVARAPSRPRILLETHSENLLLFLQLEVARGNMPADETNILWVESQKDQQSYTEPVGIDAQGRLRGWPHGVFSENVEMARELFLARRGPRP